MEEILETSPAPPQRGWWTSNRKLCLTARCACRTRNNKDARCLSTHNFTAANSNSYMFRLHKAAIIRPYVSENVKRKLYSCINFFCSIIFFLHFPIHSSWWWLFVQPKQATTTWFPKLNVVCRQTTSVLKQNTAWGQHQMPELSLFIRLF